MDRFRERRGSFHEWNTAAGQKSFRGLFLPCGTGYKVGMKSGGLAATRRSLVDRLVNWDDQKRWQEFFDTYWKLIYAARALNREL